MTSSATAVAAGGGAAAAGAGTAGSAGSELSGLNAAEASAARQFLALVNDWRSARGFEALSASAGVRFLMARKFNVDRALVLYQQHEFMRVREGLTHFDPDRSPLREELRTGKFTVLPTRDANGATLAVFNAHLHDPAAVEHRTTLQGVVYQLDVALEAADTQRAGLVFIYNMSGSKYANFDYDLSQKMLTLLKGAYPARLKKVLIVTAPLWFKAPFKVLRLFVREKLRDRVFTVSIPQLIMHVPQESIPADMGGQLRVDHDNWLVHCKKVTESKSGELVTMTYSQSQPSTPAAEHKTRRKRQPTLEQLETLPLEADGSPMGGGVNGVHHHHHHHHRNMLIEPPPEDEDQCSQRLPVPPEAAATAAGGSNGKESTAAADVDDLASSGGSSLSEDEEEENIPPDSSGMNLQEFVVHVRLKRRIGLYEEYSEIKNRPPTGNFDTARSYMNQAKNRYTDVLCYDHSRVVLRLKTQRVGGEDEDHDHDDEDEGDYINGNFVDGYKQKRAFISTQGPMPNTFADFWRMVWEQRVLVIVMTTKTMERGRLKCGQYWPGEDPGASMACGAFEIHSEEMEVCGDDFVVTSLVLKRRDTGEERPVTHFQFVSWPDYGVPESALSMLHFLRRVREKQADMTRGLGASWSGHPLGPPIVVHCSAGIGRTGTFATLDSAIRKYNDIGRVDIRTTVERIRSQRAFSIQMPDQYVFCHLAFLEYVLDMEYVDEIDLTGFDEWDDQEESD